MRLLGDLDLADEAMHEAFAAALESWAKTGIPHRPRPWLISTARFKAIDGMRRRARFDGAQRDFALYMEARVSLPERLQLNFVESKIFKSGCAALRYLKQ